MAVYCTVTFHLVRTVRSGYTEAVVNLRDTNIIRLYRCFDCLCFQIVMSSDRFVMMYWLLLQLGRMFHYLKMTGGFAVIATVSSYVGCCADVPDMPQHLLQSAADFSTLAAIVCVRTSVCEWLLSTECEEYLNRVRDLQYQRQQAVKVLEASLEDILFQHAEAKIQ